MRPSIRIVVLTGIIVVLVAGDTEIRMLKALRASTHPSLPALGQPASTTRERSPGITWIREALNLNYARLNGPEREGKEGPLGAPRLGPPGNIG